MTDFDLGLLIVGFVWLLVLGGYLADRIGENPFEGERRRDWQ